MAKKARTSTSVPEQHSAETILTLIDSLATAARRKLFDLLFRHPENDPVNDLLCKALKIANLTTKLRNHLEEMNSLQRSIDRVNHAETLLQSVREDAALLERVWERLTQAVQQIGRYTKGPESRAQKRKQRESLIRQFRKAGIVEPKKILAALRNEAPELANISMKTIRNMLAKL